MPQSIASNPKPVYAAELYFQAETIDSIVRTLYEQITVE